MVAVLEEGGHFSGINRKAQLKPLAWAPASAVAQPDDAADGKDSSGIRSAASSVSLEGLNSDGSKRDFGSTPTLQKAGSGSGSTGAGGAAGAGKDGKEGKEEEKEVVTQALLILKFGGVLTHLGRKQAEMLGRGFRETMYPPYDDAEGCALARIPSLHRHLFMTPLNAQRHDSRGWRVYM